MEESEVNLRRLILLADLWRDLADCMSFDPYRVAINNGILTEVVDSFYRHLRRYKKDHDIPRADRHKSGGFMIYWICRLKPVQVLALDYDTDRPGPIEAELLANEMFAIKVGLDCLDCTIDIENEDEFFFSLIQRLREQECPPQFLASMLYLYERQRQVIDAK